MKEQRPASAPLHASLRVPGDKSLSHRALIFGALARGGLHVSGLSHGHDVCSTRAVLTALGVSFADGPDGSLRVGGPLGAQALRQSTEALDCGNSGTTMRLMAGLLAGQAFESVLVGDASLSRRPMRRVASPLQQMGARLTLSELGTAPIRISPPSHEGAPRINQSGILPGVRHRLSGVRHVLEVGSAQVKSALLLAGLFADGWTTVTDPFGTRDHTERMLQWMVDAEDFRWDGEQASVRGGAALEGGKAFEVAGDPSSAAFWGAAALMVPHSAVVVEGVLINSKRVGWLKVIERMGAQVEIRNERAIAGEPVADLVVEHRPLRGTRIESAEVPSLVDEIPILAVVAALAHSPSRFFGLGELRHKESDRLSRVAEGLAALGARASIEGDDLVIEGGVSRFAAGSVETDADHRIAMAFSIAALNADGPVSLSDAECVAISYPSFFLHRARLAEGGALLNG